ncbi:MULTISPECIES: ABC transporter substrate-binding protein [Bacillaceae]|uniref:ABC transporter substrate-binding protein n=1 Tax=Bacillaceae TaxID=186817 RepID=UPI00047CAA15|nr:MULTISPECIES: ABC transporter substrate-binding protein [Bacillaceae]
MKKMSKMLVLLLVAALVMVGCSNEESSTKSTEDGTYEVVMAYMNFSNIQDIESVQEGISKIAKEKINATVKLMPISAGAWQEQSNLLLTGSEQLDLILSSSFYGYNTNAIKGQYLPLDDLLESHGQGILETMPEHILEGNKVNGNIYGIPSVRDWSANYGIAMRKDILDKYNIDVTQIKDWKDLGEVFAIVKENEPTLTPLVNTSQTPVYSMTGGIYDELGESLGVMRFDDSGKIVNLFEQPEYIENVELVREWYQKGYILKDAATSTEASVNVVAAGKGFGYFNNLKPGYDVQESILAGTEMVVVELSEPFIYTTASTGFNLSISKNTRNKEKTMEFLNLLYTDADVMNLLANGIEGKHYEVNEEGTIQLPEGVTESSYVFNAWMMGNNALTYPWVGNSPDYWEEMSEFNDSGIISPAFGFTFNPDPVKTEIAAASNVVTEFRRGIESGTLDPEKSLSDFNEKLKSAGLDKIIAEKQKQFDEWEASK